MLHPDRLFPADPTTRHIARRLYENVRALPIVSPHGHTDPRWFADNEAFPNPSALFIQPDHYIFRMLASQGVLLDELGVPRHDGHVQDVDPRAVWRRLAQHWHLFRGTPTRMWFEHALEMLSGAKELDALLSQPVPFAAMPEFMHYLYRCTPGGAWAPCIDYEAR